MSDRFHALHVVGLEVENVKRVRVARLKPGPGLVEISGKNGQGKTSLLDAIAMALEGKTAIPWDPIRRGEQKASIRLDLGNAKGLQLKITRRFTAQEDGSEPFTTSLKIEDADGMTPKRAQGLLDSIISGISFDPEEFVRAAPAKQVEILKGLVPGFDFDGNETDRKKAFQARTDSNRDAKNLRAQAQGISFPVDTPTERIDASALIDEMRALSDRRVEIEKKRAARHEFRIYNEQRDRIVAELRRDARDLREKANLLLAQAKSSEEVADAEEKELVGRRAGEAKWPELVDPGDGADIQARIQDADRTNTLVARRHDREALERHADAAHAKAVAFTDEIDRLDKARLDAIAAADLPATGLAIEGERVMLRGVPFEQGSQAEQIRTSLAIGMAMNPQLRVMRIRQGSALDDDAWAIIAEVAAEDGYQIFAETVRAHGPEAVIMEDGEIRK